MATSTIKQSTATKSNTVSGLSITYSKVGKIGFVEVDGTATATIPEWTWLITGIAKPLYEVNIKITDSALLSITFDNMSLARIINNSIAQGTAIHCIATYTIE